MQAKALLKNNGIPYEEVNIEENTEARDFVINEGHRTMPQIYHNGKLFVDGGFTGLNSLGVEGIKEQLGRVSVDVHNLGSL